MAEFAVVAYHKLDPGVVLAPERYDPRRQSKIIAGVPLFSISEIVNEQVARDRNLKANYVVIDTSDARDGFLRVKSEGSDEAQLGSAKKVVRKGDVIISRLRPYLRQVAFVDDAAQNQGPNCALLCSTEFFVLRSRDERSIAFLVPFLLSDRIQRILAAAQEGGHHPRFNKETLKSLIIPAAFLAARDEISGQVTNGVDSQRRAEYLIASTIDRANNCIAE